jgi:transcriptional regulator with PAS, ATPase and Fis domain
MDYFIDCFIAEESQEAGKTVSISSGAREILTAHDWPGNIRELKHFIAALVIEVKPDEKSKRHVIREQLVRECLNERAQNSDDHIREDDYALQTAYDTAAKKAIRRALNKAGGNNDKAFGLLGISRTTYYDLKKKLGI